MPDSLELELALTDLAGAIAFPAPSPIFATRVRTRIEAAPAPAEPAWRRWRRWASAPGGTRPVRRSLVIAVALLLVAATVAAAIGLGLPGIRILFGPPPNDTPPVTAVPSGPAASLEPGARLGLGERVSVADLASRAAFAVRYPTDPLVGPPDSAWIDPRKAGQVALVWRSRPDVPATLDPAVGILLMQFNGRLDEGMITKMIDSGTNVERVRVGGNPGFWITGDLHFFFYEDANGHIVDDSRRWVGDTLLWTEGGVTYRLETALGREAAIRIAESLR
jgi:hypothetical protein